MNINATILVQAINFLIVYIIVRMQLFTPIVKIIETEKNMCIKTEQTIKQVHVLIDQMQQHDLQAWQVLHAQYNKMQACMPVVEPIWSNISPRVDYPTISDGRVAELTGHMTTQLITMLGEK